MFLTNEITPIIEATAIAKIAIIDKNSILYLALIALQQTPIVQGSLGPHLLFEMKYIVI